MTIVRLLHHCRPSLRSFSVIQPLGPNGTFCARSSGGNAMNAGHLAGDELVCLTELSADNLTAAGRRMVGKGE